MFLLRKNSDPKAEYEPGFAFLSGIQETVPIAIGNRSAGFFRVYISGIKIALAYEWNYLAFTES